MDGALEANDDRSEEGEWAAGDLSGVLIVLINDSEVRAACKEEMEFMSETELCKGSTAEDCWSSTGKPPVSTKWVDAKKDEEVRSHLVASVLRRKPTRTGLTCSHPHRRHIKRDRTNGRDNKIAARIRPSPLVATMNELYDLH